MEYRTLKEMRPLGDVTDDLAHRRAIRRARLERLALLLEEKRGMVRLLSGIEYVRGPARLALRADDSPIAIAFADPVFRAEGLKGDTLGEAMDFFELSHSEAHDLFCDCHYHFMGGSIGRAVADRARVIARRRNLREIVGNLWNALALHRFAAGRRPL